MPITVLVGGGCVRPREADWGEVGLLESDGLGVMVGGDGIDFAPTSVAMAPGAGPSQSRATLSRCGL